MTLLKSDSLEVTLEKMEQYGYPRISRLDTGWHSRIRVHTGGESDGIDFEVRSEFDHATPAQAALICYSRLRAALGLVQEIHSNSRAVKHED